MLLENPQNRNELSSLYHSENVALQVKHLVSDISVVERLAAAWTSRAMFFVSFPQKRNGIVFSSGLNYLHSGSNIQSIGVARGGPGVPVTPPL